MTGVWAGAIQQLAFELELRSAMLEAMAAAAAARRVAGRVVDVRHLGKHLHFCDIDEGAGTGAVQVCFELAAFGGAAESEAESELTPFPGTKSQLKPDDRVELACRLPPVGQSCSSGAYVPRVMWWRRAARPAAQPPRKKPSKRAAKEAASLARGRQRLAWARCLLGCGAPLALPPELTVRVGQIIGVPQRRRQVRRPKCADNGSEAGSRSLRLAEKDRKGACPFADNVATLALAAYRERCADFDANRTDQTVVAAFLVHDPTVPPMAGEETEQSQLRVVALATGTKFMPADPKSVPGAGRECPWHVRDSHAEVLARRSLLRYLHGQLRICYDGASGGGVTGRNDQPRPAEKRSIFCRAPGQQRCSLQPGVSFHLYSSTVPCGNASLSRWASQSQPQSGRENFEDLLQYPRGHVENPERVLFSARHEGQLAALVKGPISPTIVSDIRPGPEPGAQVGPELEPGPEPEPEPEVGESGDARAAGMQQQQQQQQQPPRSTQVVSCDRQGTIPPGCSAVPAGPSGMAAVAGSSDYSLSCSDKIARWQCLGLQGTLLMQFLEQPLYLQSCTFGRKFNQQRCERALCCRLQDFCVERCPELADVDCMAPRPPPAAAAAAAAVKPRMDDMTAPTTATGGKASRFRIHHAAMLGTGVLLDPDAVIVADGAADTAAGEERAGGGTGAKFAAICGSWALGDDEVAWHDGRTGQRPLPTEDGVVTAVTEQRQGQVKGTVPHWAIPTASASLYLLYRELAALQRRAIDTESAGSSGSGAMAVGRERVAATDPAALVDEGTVLAHAYSEVKQIVGKMTGYAQARELLLFGGRTKLCRTLEGQG
jgi:hypothetical protein